MKILLITTSLQMGGAELQVLALGQRMAALGHTVHLAFLTGPQELAVDPAITVHDLAMNMRQPWTLWRGYVRLRRLVQQLQADVVHSHMVHANLLARLVRMLTPMRRLICSAHSTNEGGAWRMLAYRLTDHWADLSTNVSQEAVDAFIQAKAVPPGRMHVMHNGIDTQRFAPDPAARAAVRATLGIAAEQPLLLNVGRLHPAKNQALLIDAFAELRHHHPNAVLVVAGDGPCQRDLEQAIAARQLGASVRLLGRRHDVPALMNACDLFVLSSDFEGFGLVVAEAMACETLVVATDCGGVREVLGDPAWLVPVRDRDTLARRIAEAIEVRPAVRAALVAHQRERVEALFALPTLTRQWLDLYAASKA